MQFLDILCSECIKFLFIHNKQRSLDVLLIKALFVLKCTRSRDRTGTALLPLVFETSASTNSAIRADYCHAFMQSCSLAICENIKNFYLFTFIFYLISPLLPFPPSPIPLFSLTRISLIASSMPSSSNPHSAISSS